MEDNVHKLKLSTPSLFEKYLVCEEQVPSCLSMLETHCKEYTSLASAALHSAYFVLY